MKKLLSTILIFLIALLQINCGIQGKRIIYLIPQGFEGKVYVIFNQEDGKPTMMENGGVVYRIGQNGVLRTQGSTVSGPLSPKYFYEDSNQKRTELPYYTSVDIQNKKIDSSLTICYNSEWGFRPNKMKEESKRFETFYVSSLKTSKSVTSRVEYIFDKTVDE